MTGIAGALSVDGPVRAAEPVVAQIPECVEGCLVGQIGSAADDQPGPLEQLGAVRGDLVAQNPQLSLRIVGRTLGQVDEDAEHPGALDVPEELVAETFAVPGAFDESGHVRDDEICFTPPDNSQVGDQGGERIVGDARFGRRDHRDQGGLADVGEADERDVRQELQLEVPPDLLTRFAQLGEARGAPLVGEEPGIAPPTVATAGGPPPGAGGRQVGNGVSRGVGDHGAHGYRHDHVRPVAAVLLLALAADTFGSGPMWGVTEGEQRRHVRVGDEPDVAALAAVAAVGTAAWYMSFTPERHTAVATVAGFGVQLGFVDESGHGCAAYRPRVVEPERR